MEPQGKKAPKPPQNYKFSGSKPKPPPIIYSQCTVQSCHDSMLSPRHQLDCLSVRLTGLSRPQYHHSRLHKAPLIHRGSASSESVSFVETANDNWNRIEWVFSPQSDLPGPLSNSRMLKKSTLGFGQSVRVLECLACKADHEHCCLHIGVSIRAEGGKIGPSFHLATWENPVHCASRETLGPFLVTRVLPSLCAIILHTPRYVD